MVKLSIGFPIYNGENYGEAAIESLLAQSYADFELIIADNASTDGTEQMCRNYAAKDSRIKYFRHETNMGAAYNFNFTVERASGEYFKWAAHDDVLSINYLERCMNHLDRNPDVVLCHSGTEVIDASGTHIGYDDYPMRLDSEKTHVRFRDLSIIRHECFLVFGVIKREVLMRTRMIDTYEGSDRVLLCELGLYGKFGEVAEYLFIRRRHEESGCARPEREDRLAWYNPEGEGAGTMSYPNWSILKETLAAIVRTPIGLMAKTSCLVQILELLVVRRKFLGNDLIEGLKWSLKRTRTGHRIFYFLKHKLK